MTSLQQISFSVDAFTVNSHHPRRHSTKASWLSSSLPSETSVEMNHINPAVSSSSSSSSSKPKEPQQNELWKQGRTSISMDLLRQYQKDSSHIIQSYVPGEDFNPIPWIGTNNHFQTIGGFLARQILPELKYVKKDNWISSIIQAMANKMKRHHYNIQQNDVEDNIVAPLSFWDERERIETPDGDWFHADYKYVDSHNKNNMEEKESVEQESLSSSLSQRRRQGSSSASAHGLVILLHGLESNSESPLTKEMANGYVKLGMDVVCLNFRGCSGIPNDKLGGYHLGFTDDLLYYLSLVKSRYYDSKKNDVSSSSSLPPIYLSGFSLGSNVVLKALGELGEGAKDEYNIQGAALQCAPLDQEYNHLKMESTGINRQVYSGNLLKSMKTRLQHQLDTICDGDENTTKFDYHRAISATKISQLEDAYLGPVYGFDSYLDYYRKTSSIFFLDGIAVPTLIVNAKDDPFFDPKVWPIEKSCEGGGTAPIKMIRSDNGGHLGFFLHQIEDEDELLNLQSDPLSPSWSTAECTRFVAHVHSILLQ